MTIDVYVTAEVTLDDGMMEHPVVQGIFTCATSEERDWLKISLLEALKREFTSWSSLSGNRATTYSKISSSSGIYVKVTMDQFTQPGYRPPNDTITISKVGCPDNPDDDDKLL